jgi:NAD(P)-dependent dehydrogenase (short-subunit alcohol dehydrogenase family)
MPSVQEPYCLKGRTALVVGPANELRSEVAAALTAAGASVSPLIPELPLSTGAIAAIEAADILILQTLVEPEASAGADDWEAIDRLHRILVTLPTALMVKAVPAMSRRHWGRVVFLAGGDETTPASVAVQSAQSALMQAEARQLAAAGITVNLLAINAAAKKLVLETRQAIASAALYFASDESGFVTGQTLQFTIDSMRK